MEGEGEKFGVGPESEEEENNPIEKENIHERLASIIRSISGRPNLFVTTEVHPVMRAQMAAQGKDADKEWFSITEKGKEFVHIPPEIEQSENFARGAAAHEAGHIAISRLDFVPEKVMQQTGFQMSFLSTEERPTDNVIKKRFEGAGEWIDEVRHEQHAEARGALKEKLGYMPKFVEINNLLVFEPHVENKEEYASKEAIDIYEGIRKFVEQYEKTLPPEGSPEEKVEEFAKRRYKIFYSKIWPEIKKTLEQDMNTEEMRQAMQEMAEKKEEQEKEFNEMMDQLAENMREELEDALEQMQQSLDKQRNQKKGEGNQTEEEASPQEKQFGAPLPPMSPELIEAVSELLKRLPEEKKKELETKAREVMEQIEDEMIKNLAPKLIDTPESHAEYEERMEREVEENKKKEKIDQEFEKGQEELKAIERKEAEMASHKDVYEKTFQEIREIEEELFRRLEEIFHPNIKRSVRLKSSGSRINLPSVFKWEAGKAAGVPVIDNRIFESVHNPEERDYVFEMLVDLSGSMEDKIHETFKGVVLLAEVLNRLGIKNEIIGFHYRLLEYKKLEEELTDEVRRRISGMLEEIKYGTGTYSGAGLEEAERRLEEQKSKEKFIICLTDGQPSDRERHEDAVRRITKTTDQKLIGIGLGPYTEMVAHNFPAALPNVNIKKLAQVLGDLLEDMILNPEKYKAESPKW